MSTATRGTGKRRSNACWTCKLRRKKCDAARPVCVACESRNIPCHGYGGWPGWMDGAEREHAELERIQKLVRENKRRRRRELVRDLAGKRRGGGGSGGVDVDDDEVTVAEEEVEQSLDDPQTRQNDWGVEVDDTPEVSGSKSGSPVQVQELTEMHLTTCTPDEAAAASYHHHSLAPTPDSTSQFRLDHQREAELLMHYLDHVFALQFRFHSPAVANGGRGWLLWLLTETKPLYHAALSLGALHQHSLLARSARGQRYHDTLNELNDHHNRALQELQIFLQSSYDDPSAADLSRKRKLQILACGVQLISFELFRGGTSQWQVHVDALAIIVSSIQQERRAHPQTPWNVSEEHSSGMPTPEGGTDLSHDLEDTAEQFLIGAVLWFDITSCVSTNKGPRLLQNYDTLLHGQIDLANIVGCQPWVGILIGEIASLNEWKYEATHSNSLSVWKLFEKADPVRRRLLGGIQSLRSEIDDAFSDIGFSHLSTPAVHLVMSNPLVHSVAIKRGVTMVFAHAALVYLNTTVSGAHPSLEDVRASVTDTANALQELRSICDSQALRSLIWPICIAGCMAEDVTMQRFFRSLIRDLGDEAHDFGNSATALAIMEKCWRCRDEGVVWGEGKGWDWFAAMDSMGQRVLLV